ncbi:antibiotic biosynthesis monooxygenase [Frankia sp. CNm7]|uniref:Antibiotic biosynthesis monooxygenase n=1 Tax=Frankia nepalensis TaxID=1836974 RepID=A0A937UV96_9ACTN|nr:antibiotic biosynthesis monooxygenase [Frankia nepalensis]MBL7501039.1 antibiotic biosynthesis monooxygenase [Frankia nepalensis]MBL7514252.1 antibiotic biosynthesis monooxygenase [Frankia nepalensis]MBL7518811.1 antibiotic biosynthesis monooxygenase [Frankia nepalensis]MBL7632011.1 antibiotic biosynthesis monooxygenase [Frankia nepalensis]
MSRVRVMIWAVDPADAPGAVEAAYHEISSQLVGTPGLLGNQLMRSAHDPSRFVVVSEWAGMAEFVAWERDASHKPTTSPLRPLQDPDRRPVIYEQVAAYGETGALAEAGR